jgi:hypothetical protein
MEVSYLAVGLATLAQFVVGAIWYMPIFGKLWGQIHGFEKLSKKEQQQMQSEMGPYYAVQLAVTGLTALVLAKFIVLLPQYSPYCLAMMCWAGFLVPAEVSSVIFGGTEGKWISKKIAVMIGGSLACTLAAAAVISWIQ